MPLDHYVSQVHLRKFYSPFLANQMHAIQKPSLTRYECDAYSQCRIMGGSTNPFLSEPRAIELFLEAVEPKYNEAVDAIRNGEIGPDVILSIAGFAAYVASCSQAALRLMPEPVRAMVEETAKILEECGELPKPPEALGSDSIKELLDSGALSVSIDPKYPQAHAIMSILRQTSSWGNSDWEIIINENEASPFFTSDFPVAIEKTHDPRILNRIIPLAPDLAVRILPRIGVRGDEPNLDFPHFKYRRIKANKQQIRVINTAIVQCAESKVYFPNNADWVPGFVEKLRYHRIESFTRRIPMGKGSMIWSGMEVNPDSLRPHS